MNSFEDPRRVLARHGLRPKKAFSQNFLISPRAIEAIVRACGLAPGQRVLELGPGCGTLTFALAETGAEVHALERDPEMLRVLEAERSGRNVTIVPGDAKEVSLADFVVPGERIVVAGNLPYAITGAIFRRLCEQHELVSRAVLMVQREVRDRLVAQPSTGEYGALTVFVSQLFAVETVLHIPRTAFHPPPKVTSSVVRLLPLAQPRARPSAMFDRVVHAAFQARRKTLRNALAQAVGVANAEAALAACGIDGMRRGETLSVEELGQVAVALATSGNAESSQ
ncbi:MAG TPA: 16S rRNA (adenine(1518)-N(6)/adenine(1519)-N(6))-dimethyltransferase RsmA [Polyangiales bacterium]|nr:16S rRNA (adenine(1518)-N(6)/adenine(1519)-N(6))-dimethyltransferase RsmA [Polyangiales bacterium]